MMTTSYTVEVRGRGQTLSLAARELRRYVRKMLPGVQFTRASAKNAAMSGFILAAATDVPEAIGSRKVRDGEDLDQIFLVSRGQKLVLAGNNPRSVLFAVYDFLERCGARWLHAGPGGESLPRLRRLRLSGWNVAQTASFRYRGVDVEGAFTLKHAKAFIDWMAKKKMNHFYMQFENGAFWYRRMVPGLKVSEALQWDKQIAAEVKKRGLALDWYGHGWTCNAIGKRVVGLDKAYKVPAKIKPLLAQVNDKRGWYDDYPLTTQLCLTNAEVRRKIMSYLERWVRRHKEVDVVGFMLADGRNNQCECAKCAEFRGSEIYVDYVNEAAERVHRIRPDVKIEFVAYNVTLEPPVRTRVRNPHGNLIFLPAPLRRCYRHRLHDENCFTTEPIPEFPVINRQPQRVLNRAFARYYAGWRNRYSGDARMFDYHMLSLKFDFLAGNIPQMASRDIKDLKKHKYDGYVGCQPLRCFWPTGLGMKVIAETLWDVKKSYRMIRRQHLEEWFGAAAEAAGEALNAMYRATAGRYPAHQRMPGAARLRRSMKQLQEVAARLRTRSRNHRHSLTRQRLRFLADHAEYLANEQCLGMGDATMPEERDTTMGQIREFFHKHEKDAEHLLDAQYHGKKYMVHLPG